MISFETVIRLVGDVQASELRHWIEERWVRPEAQPEGYLFHEVDVARVRLIRELRHDLAIDEDALPLVLQLLDQIYTLRRRLRLLNEAVEAQPTALREAILARLGGERRDE